MFANNDVYIILIASCDNSETTTQASATTATSNDSDDSVPENIKKLGLTLDPAKQEEREKKVEQAKERYDDEFGSLDMKVAYQNLFEILWYSQLPCFDVKDITSEVQDEMSLVKRC